MTRLDYARRYWARGWSVVPVPNRQKGPRVKGWQNLRLDETGIANHLQGDGNLGVILGGPSGGLVDVDLDCPEALQFAPRLLPETNAIFGRKSKPQSHWLYKVSGNVQSLHLKDPVTGTTIVELRGDRKQTIFPPSIHPSGEQIEWVCEGNPSQKDHATLSASVNKLAARCLVARYLPTITDRAGLLNALPEIDPRIATRIREWLDLATPDAACRSNRISDQNDWPLGVPPPHLSRRERRDLVSLALVGISETEWTRECEERVRSALSVIPMIDYYDWLHVGIALHSTHWPIAQSIWDEASRKCPEKFNEGEQDRTWASFDRYKGQRKITLPTLFFIAKQYGWDREASSSGAVPADKPSEDRASKEAERNGAPSCFASMISAADLRTMTFEQVRYIVPGFIVEGLTLLVGRPKVGKSWWVLDLCLACAADRVALGKFQAMQGDVLYLALEDGKRRLQKRLDKLLPTCSGQWPDRLKLVPMGGWRRADQGGLEDIEAWCRSVAKPVLIVIDTLERFRKPANGKAPLYSADYEAVSGLQKIAERYQVAIVVLHHDRKSDADDAFDTVSGTLGLTGAADTILIIKRRANGVILYARGRDIEESETAMQFDKETCRWAILGKASEVQRSTERARVIAALKAAGQPLSTKQIMNETDMPNRNAVDILLGKMVRDGEIVRVGRGRYDLSAENSGQNGQKERNDSKATDSTKENENLSNLSDLSARKDKPHSARL
jgi:hypothetical protein